jgi:hypothetical protein
MHDVLLPVMERPAWLILHHHIGKRLLERGVIPVQKEHDGNLMNLLIIKRTAHQNIMSGNRYNKLLPMHTASSDP